MILISYQSKTFNVDPKRKMKMYFLLIVLLFLLMSCVDTTRFKVVNATRGWWDIDTAIYTVGKTNYNLQCMMEREMMLSFDEKSYFPSVWSCDTLVKYGYEHSGSASLEESTIKNDTIPYRVVIKTGNRLFSGKYKVVFYKDMENHLLKMELYSDKLYLICHKDPFDFDNNMELIKDVEKLTWTNRPKD